MPIYNYTPINGKQELEGLVIGHYSDPMIFYREYIQNACDSIADAVNNGTLPSMDDGYVAISISPYYKSIEIRDNGIGISKENVLPTLMDMYHSDKDGISSAGRFGIGRLSGGGFCRKLVFRTTTKGETEESVFSMDVDLLRSILADKSKDIPASEVMQEICSIEYNNVAVEDHYMIIQLQNVIQASEDILDETKVVNFIQDIAPIDYNTAFKQLIKNSAGDYYDKCKQLRHIHVSVNNQTDIKKRYGLTIIGNNDEIEKLRFFTLQNNLYGELAWGWYAVTPFSTQIPSTDYNAGIRLRCHNISLDKEIINQYFKEERGNLYFYGEIFVSHPNISPNTGRQGLRSSDEATALIAQLKEYCKTLSSIYKKANTIKGKLKNIKERFDKYQQSAKTCSQSEKEALLQYLQNDVKTFVELVNNPKQTEEIKDISQIYYSQYVNEYSQDIEKLLHPTPSEEPNKVPSSLTETSVSFDIPLLTQNTKPNTPQLQQTTDSTSHNPTTPPIQPLQKAASKPTSKSKDIFQQLLEGGFDDKEVNLIRRVLGMMTVICPPQNKSMLEKLKEDTIELLIKHQN